MNKKGLLWRVLTVIVAVMSVAMFDPSQVQAATAKNSKKASSPAIWSGKVDTSWYSGKAKSYDISTAEQLAGLAYIVSNGKDSDRFEGITINLKNDIYLNDISKFDDWETKPPKNNWSPIGRIGSPGLGLKPFAGTFNGNGHYIVGMYCNNCNTKKDDPVGLFSYVSGALIKDLNMYSCIIISDKEDVQCGMISGIAEGTSIQQCKIEQCGIEGASHIGGIVGEVKNVNSLYPSAALAFGVIGINPGLLNGVKGNRSASSIENCIVNNLALFRRMDWRGGVGGILGRANVPTAIYKCEAESLHVQSVDPADPGTSRYGNCGAMLGEAMDKKTFAIKDCIARNYSREDGGSEQYDKKYVTMK